MSSARGGRFFQHTVDQIDSACDAERRQGLEETVATTLEEVRELNADWLALAERAGRIEIDADPDFFLGALTWLDPQPRPWIALLRDHGHPAALVVGRLRSQRIDSRVGYVRLRTPKLRCLEIVYGGLISDGTERANAWILGLLRSRLQSGEIEHLSIHHVPSEHRLFFDLCRLGRRRGPIRAVQHWYCSLANAPTQSKQRQYERKLERHFGGNVQVETITDADGVARYIERASSITRQTYHHRLGIGVDSTPRVQCMLTELARLGYLRAYLLVGNATPVAYTTAVVKGNHATLMHQGYLPDHRELRPGNFLLARVAKDLESRGIQTLDFGFGETVQKGRFGTHFQEQRTLGWYGAGARAVTAWALESSAVGLTRIAERALRRSDSLRVIKKRWRMRLEGKT